MGSGHLTMAETGAQSPGWLPAVLSRQTSLSDVQPVSAVSAVSQPSRRLVRCFVS